MQNLQQMSITSSHARASTTYVMRLLAPGTIKLYRFRYCLYNYNFFLV